MLDRVHSCYLCQWRRSFVVTCNPQLCHLIQKTAVDSIIANDDVNMYWSILSGNWQEEEAALLIKMLVDHWITIRGFSFASAFMERHKQEHKKSLQKSKGIRKALYEKKVDDKNKAGC